MSDSPVIENSEHKTDENCWCNPILDYTDPQTGHQVWVHNKTPNEFAHRGRALLSLKSPTTINGAVSGAAAS
ncbi:MAG: hypothetical protein EKK68_07590 [Candidatus Competibacteraceae bacterium]|nr:MAG: hypothetical protein EKK68_07590 [Candidatus Competibacteraceae bacterium]